MSAHPRAQRVMDAYPGPVTLHHRRRPLVALLLGSIVWTVLFLALAVVGLPADVDPDFEIRRHRKRGRFVLVEARRELPIELDEDGLKFVVFDLVDSDPPERISKDFDVRLRDNFGLSPKALASLMDTWRAMVLAIDPGPR